MTDGETLALILRKRGIGRCLMSCGLPWLAANPRSRLQRMR